MFLEIKGFLKTEEIARLQELAGRVRFVDGRISNPHNLAKNNLQASETDPLHAESSRIVGEAFMRSEPFHNFTFPRHIAPPLLARYEVGMTYGAHADTSHMRFGNDIRRSDLSATVWLNPPESYDGGELVVHLGTKLVVIKGEPGSVVVYPSTQLHEVAPVRRGQRLVSITFIESMIPDEFLRTQLYELNEVAAIEGLKMSWEGRVRLEAVRNNLRRLWAR
ncbi:MAG TPA: Fe2+-dependent dioxygenase [Rhizomicrobium sp.]|jgi:PKHD-type hydroxylase|nr:Fe2+-dependent dioxygenase [Rhizomicrobium sp.]